MAHHVIYVPGLGDDRSYGQNLAIQIWRLFGVKPHYFPLIWKSNEDFDIKFKRLTDKIDSLLTKNNKVSLVGVSAGASAVINAYAARQQIYSVVCICGKIQHPETIDESYFTVNPPFHKSIYRVKSSLDCLGPDKLAKIMSIHPISDPIVPIAHTIIPGAKEVEVPVRGHGFSIMFSIIFASPKITKFIKSN